ncbi:hypothetical protein PQS31_10875 [Luteimonas sp BLCC-B24]|uniref:hypothetical protein n=1 Tax=Luteimonas sp. BLCC-B24 TaxID=3025317 RepID=UPI00234CD282|nr:hypothetical protein [Luteimonas sp. BLCC-B24]MDC7807323.1 hypothetical protein [Luteimonas sp. BLCC-B24]
MTTPDLAELHMRLDALETALAGDVHDASAQMTEYHERLHLYIAEVGPQAPVEALRGLLQLQNSLLLQMHERKHVIGEALRAARRTEHASRAYAGDAR